MSKFYDGSYKLTSDFNDAKETGANIANFRKYKVYRALRFKEKERDAVLKLCGHFDQQVEDGQWIVEQPNMVNNRIQYEVMEDKSFKETFTKYDASGILGCGKGSERFQAI